MRNAGVPRLRSYAASLGMTRWWLEEVEAGGEGYECEEGSQDDVEGVVIAADDGSQGDGYGDAEKDEADGDGGVEKDEGDGEGGSNMCAGEGDGVDASVLENPAVEDAAFVDLGRRRCCGGLDERAWRVGRDERSDGIAKVRGDEDDEPESGDLAAQVGEVEGEESERDERIAGEVGHLQQEADAGAQGAGLRGDGGNEAVVEVEEALLDAWVWREKELSGLPVRDEEERDGEPVAENGGGFGWECAGYEESDGQDDSSG